MTNYYERSKNWIAFEAAYVNAQKMRSHYSNRLRFRQTMKRHLRANGFMHEANNFRCAGI